MQKEVIRRNGRPRRHTVINRKQRSERDGIRNPRPSVGKPDSKKWSEIQKAQTHDAGQGSRPLERKHGKEVLGEIVDDTESALGPAQGNQVLAKNIALGEARFLDYFAEFHVVEHFHAQGSIGADRVVDRTPDQVES